MAFLFRNRPSHLDAAAVRRALDFTERHWGEPPEPVHVEFTEYDGLNDRYRGRYHPQWGEEPDRILLNELHAQPYATPAHEGLHAIEIPALGREGWEAEHQLPYYDRPSEQRAWSWGTVTDHALTSEDAGQGILFDPKSELFPVALDDYRNQLGLYRERQALADRTEPGRLQRELDRELTRAEEPGEFPLDEELMIDLRILEGQRRDALQRALREGRF